MQKLTLSVNKQVIQRAKKLAAREGTSVSRLVESFLREAASDDSLSGQPVPPVLRRLRGCLKSARPSDYRRHLEAKYG